MRGKVKNMWMAAAALAAAVSGCTLDGPALEQEFTDSSYINFTVKGEVEHRFDPLNWQTVCSLSEGEFTVCNDNMSDFYILRCSSVPREEGDEVVCDVTWTTYSDIKKKKGLDFKVTKADVSSGAVWLWCSSAMIGAAVIIDE